MRALQSLPGPRRFAAGLVCAVVCWGASVAAGLAFVVEPYLQWPTGESIVVRWETDAPASAEVRWGDRSAVPERAASDGLATLHEVTVTGLKPGQPYFYQAVSVSEAGEELAAEVLTFTTAVEPDAAFGFVVLCDTQSNPEVVRRLAEHAYAQRPLFTLLGGDLVSDGLVKEHWTAHFFPNMAPLNARVPLIPILGNHEKDSPHFYEYFTVPEPKYYYQFSYGNLDVFMLDSQKPFGRNSDLYTWMEGALAESQAAWKIVMMHKPPYSSDEDDYGDTAEGRSVHGDFNSRMLVRLYEEHGVDLVWSGHIHSYERTFPLRGNRAVAPGEGPVYMVTGGGGGGLERAAPQRAWFTAKVYRGHHYCYVTVNGNHLRIEARDLDDRIFDWVELSK